ncbi:hypothetical protein CWB99_13565 [Pseudoalteromonas rubra]|uniref:Uncharacterized protein n=1 Tax=Pseudoalteromonas rubra TaxID=43658 RepID=A0A5S3WL32_9GAMM|nr:hypothetical protein [Pseudoalteromonas rubra]TMP27716.1 hypothetical protein CWB99_13565 [Pseudoalteromonas rubra]TMP32444.1 hypothetical protein CWC00_12215 [Pseudoalteromonas rubra]
MKKYLLGSIIALASTTTLAVTDIGLGTLKGVKVYDFSNDKTIRLYFNNDVQYELAGCNKTATITYSKHSTDKVDHFLSLALAAYMSGKKVRLTSATNDCEVSLISLQENRF